MTESPGTSAPSAASSVPPEAAATAPSPAAPSPAAPSPAAPSPAAPSPAAMGAGPDGRDPAIDAALRVLDEAAGDDDPQAQIEAAQHVHDVLQGRLSGVSGA